MSSAFKFRNVNDAFRQLMQGISWGTIHTRKKDTRNGLCHVVTDPVVVTYSNPRERVLWNPARDANPFFHVIEALWMLAGRNDIDILTWFNKNMSSYSDDGVTQHAAYGHRWHYLAHQVMEAYPQADGRVKQIQTNYNQLLFLIKLLHTQPDTRRAVLSMWDPMDLARITEKPEMKDVACNTHAYFELEVIHATQVPVMPLSSNDTTHYTDKIHKYALNMTVCNRSNDILWGMLGANYVHFTFLQEYIANCLKSLGMNVEVGKYHHFTNNLHIYADKADFQKWLKEESPDQYFTPDFPPSQFVHDHKAFNTEVQILMQELKMIATTPNINLVSGTRGKHEYTEPFIRDTVLPMISAWLSHKRRNYDAALTALDIGIHHGMAKDWHWACTVWMERRAQRWAENQAKDHPVPVDGVEGSCIYPPTPTLEE